MSKTPATDHYQDRHDEHEYDDDPGDCWHCGGEGFIADCFDGFCEAAEYGCEDCTRPCPECARVQACGVMEIPTRCMVRVTKLKEPARG